MRRTPRTSRSIDRSIPSQLVLRPRTSLSPHCAALTCSPLLRTTSAPFSTSTSYNSLLSNDREKHVASIRKWQKRLLGDSEPIGSRVDPYDASSPIRIRPEETGEEVETLEELAGTQQEEGEEKTVRWASAKSGEPSLYMEADTGAGLAKVGGDKWIQKQKEIQLLERFNMMLAHSGEGYDAVTPKFGPRVKPRTTKDLNALFHQAVVEIYTLDAADINPVFTNTKRHSHDVPKGWTENIQVLWSPEAGVVLKNPDPSTTDRFLKNFYVQQQESLKKKIVSKKTEGKLRSTTRPDIKDAKSTLQFLESASSGVQKDISSLRYEFLQSATQSSQENVSGISRELRNLVTQKASKSTTVVKPELQGVAAYNQIAITDPKIQLAFKKRLLELTGHHIPDPTLYSSRTLSALHKAFFTIAQPAPKKVVSSIKLSLAPRSADTKRGANSNNKRPIARRVASPLTRMQNVKIYGKRVGVVERDTRTGIRKVIKYALMERGLAGEGNG
ncbi:hypothetical protein B0J11DRAFT_451723, partial [Dendryphion nanum]